VQSILKNRAYLGEARSGSFVKIGAHEPLIDRETWEAAQRVKGVRSPRSANPALLSGLVRCAACRYRMKSQWQPGRGDKPPLRTYRCGRHTSGGKCPSPGTISCHVLDAHVESAFFEAVGDLQAVPHVASVEVGALTDALRDAEREFNAFRDDQELTGLLGREGFLDGLRARGARVDTARQALGEATEQVAVGELPDRAALEETWPTLKVEDKHRLLALVLDVVMVRSGRGVPVHERAAILLAGEAPDDLPRRGVRAEPLRPFVWPVNRPDEARVALAQ